MSLIGRVVTFKYKINIPTADAQKRSRAKRITGVLVGENDNALHIDEYSGSVHKLISCIDIISNVKALTLEKEVIWKLKKGS